MITASSVAQRLDELHEQWVDHEVLAVEPVAQRRGFYGGARSLRGSIMELRALLAGVAAEPGALHDSRNASALEKLAVDLLEWDRRIMALRFRGRHREIHVQIRGLGHVYFGRIRHFARLAVQGCAADQSIMAAGLSLPVWLIEAERELTMRVARMNTLLVVIATITAVVAAVTTQHFRDQQDGSPSTHVRPMSRK